MKKNWKNVLLCLLAGVCSAPVLVSAETTELHVVDTCPVVDEQKVSVNDLFREESVSERNDRGLAYDIEYLNEFEELMKDALIQASQSETNYVDITAEPGMEALEGIDVWAFGAYSPYVLREDITDFDDYAYKMGMVYLVYDAYGSLTTENIAGWRVFNTISDEETRAYFAEVDEKVEEALEIIPADATDEMIALLFHDYIAYEFEYDYDRLDNLPMESHTSGGCLTNAIGVCDGYSYTYSYLLHKFGLECDVVISEEMNHAWNIVKLNNKSYNVDATWDDPVRDRLGQVVHSYFLASDATFLNLSHGLCDEEGYTCDDTRYESAFWYPINSQIAIDGSMAYYIIYDGSNFYGSENGIYARNMEDNTVEQILSIPGKFVGENNNWWAINYSGLFLHDDYLYYNTDREIKRVKTDGTDDQVIYDLGETSGYIYGSKKLGNKIKYFVSESVAASGEANGGTYYIAPYELKICKHEICDEVFITEPTCEEGGEKKVTCRECSKSWVRVVDSLGHDWESEYTVDQEPTYLQTGVKSIHCSRCDVIQEGSSVILDVLENPFVDLKPGAYYCTPVLWAVENGITNGRSKTEFRPIEDCTRAQVVTFLWRAAGSPEPSTQENPFKDVDPILHKNFYKAILWAKEVGVTSGYRDNTFRPDEAVTRAEYVTFQYRASGAPEVDVTENPFVDVSPVAHKNFISAIIWAYENKITTGKDASHFLPNETTSRANVVTFLYRGMAE